MGSDPQEICRLCAGTFLSVVPIFGNDDLPMKIQNISSLEVKSNDGLPAQVCHQCAQLVNLCYHFKLRCESSDYFFRRSKDFSNYVAEEQVEQHTADIMLKVVTNAENEKDEAWGLEQLSSDGPESTWTKMKPAIPEYLLEPYIRARPGKKPHFPVETLASLLEEHREVILTRNGQIQPKAAPVWKYLCELLNDKLQGTYSTSPNNIYTYVKCNRYNLQSYLGLDSDRRHKGKAERDEDEVITSDHDYYMPEGLEKNKVEFIINLSEEEWLDMTEDEESLLSRQGWSRINKYFRMATATMCRMTYSSRCVSEPGEGLRMQGKCQFCSSVFTGYVNGEELLPGEPIVVHCTYVGAFNQPHPRIAEQREIFKQEGDA